MARAILTDAERLDWERFPADPDPDVIGVYFTLADGEVDVLRRLPAPAGRLATAVAVAAIRWLGFVPAELDNAPAAGVQRLAGQLDVDVEELAAYEPSERTAREHRQRATDLAHFRDPDAHDVDDVEDLLVEHALEHDSPLALLRTTAITLRNRQLLRPGISTLERLVASARARAERDTYARLEALLDAQTRRALDALCVTDMRLGVSRLVCWAARRDRRARRRSSRSWRSSRSCASSAHLSGSWTPCPRIGVGSSPRSRGARRPRRSPADRIAFATPRCCASATTRQSGCWTRSSTAPTRPSARHTARLCASCASSRRADSDRGQREGRLVRPARRAAA